MFQHRRNAAGHRRAFFLRHPAGPAPKGAALALCLATLGMSFPTQADMGSGMDSGMGHASGHTGGHQDGHSGTHVMVPPPASIMGANMIPKGSFMVNLIPMWMHMDGLQQGTDSLSDAEAVTSIPNRFAGQPMPGNPMMRQPATLRMVPTEMDMSAQMLGFMYGLTDSINFMVMGTYVQKSMTMQVFRGPAGAVPLGTSKTSVKGLGDTAVAAMIRLWDQPNQEIHLNLGLGLPTGSTTETGTMLMPNGMRMEMRLPYGMQLGGGTYDFMPSLVYTGRDKALSFGGMLRGRYPTANNDDGWRMGNFTQLTAWGGYDFNDHVTGTLRLAGTTEDSIQGQDPRISGPSPRANPDFYGGDSAEAFIGVIAKFKTFGNHRGRIAAEVGMPFYQDLNGVQLAKSWSLTLSAMAHF
jgi:hypothetical protein